MLSITESQKLVNYLKKIKDELFVDYSRLFADYSHYQSQLFTDYPPTIRRLFADYSPTIRRLFADFSPTILLLPNAVGKVSVCFDIVSDPARREIIAIFGF